MFFKPFLIAHVQIYLTSDGQIILIFERKILYQKLIKNYDI